MLTIKFHVGLLILWLLLTNTNNFLGDDDDYWHLNKGALADFAWCEVVAWLCFYFFVM